jgi:hypothetical protein
MPDFKALSFKFRHVIAAVNAVRTRTPDAVTLAGRLCFLLLLRLHEIEIGSAVAFPVQQALFSFRHVPSPFGLSGFDFPIFVIVMLLFVLVRGSNHTQAGSIPSTRL